VCAIDLSGLVQSQIRVSLNTAMNICDPLKLWGFLCLPIDSWPSQKVFFFPHTIHKTHKYLCCSLATACFLFWSLKGLYNSWCSFDMSPCLIFYEKQPGGSRCCFFTFLGYDRSAPPSLSLALNHSYYHHITLNMAPRNRYKVGRNMLNYKTLYRYVGYYKFIL